MPGANGLEVFLEAKRWSPDTRFVLLTGSATAETIDKLVEAGINGVLLKDATETETVEAVRHRELAVLQAIARRHYNVSAAESLGISPKTADNHRNSLMR